MAVTLTAAQLAEAVGVELDHGGALIGRGRWACRAIRAGRAACHIERSRDSHGRMARRTAERRDSIGNRGRYPNVLRADDAIRAATLGRDGAALSPWKARRGGAA